MRKQAGRLAHRAEYLFGRCVFGLLSLLPTGAARGIGSGLGLVFYRVSGRHRRTALANLEMAMGATLRPRERARVARAAFAHLGRIAADAPLFPRHLRRPLDAVALYDGVEHLHAAVARGKGVLVFSGHYGHWELVALLQHRLGVPMTMVVNPMRNPFYDRYFVRLRSLSGNPILSKRLAARPILTALRQGRAVAILIDQNVRGSGGVFVDFFGRAASTTPSLATLALRSGAAIVPVFSHFLPDGRLSISYRPAIVPERSGGKEDDVLALTQRCTALLEAEIRRRPEGWFWMHERWRTRPRPAAPAGDVGPSRAATEPAATEPAAERLVAGASAAAPPTVRREAGR